MQEQQLTLQQQEELERVRARLFGITVTLVAFGLVLIYSASGVRAGHFGWEMKYLASQATWVVVGTVGMLIMSRIDYRLWARLSLPILVITIGLLAAVRLPGVGTRVRGAYRWLRFGGFNMQPSEVAKLSLVIVMAAFLARRKNGKLRFWQDVLPAACIMAAACGLIVIEPDFGTAALVGVILLGMLFVGGARWWQIGALVLAGVPPVGYYGFTRFDHILKRILAWLAGMKTGAGWQPWMSKMALGSGGVTGMGLGEGTAKLYYLPDAHTDFILAIAGQELGLIGAVGVVVAFAYFVHQGLRLVRLAPDRFGALLAFGIVTWIGLQAAFNVAVVTASIPPKGISLPFVSFGGSGLCVSLAAVGVLTNIARLRVAEIPETEAAGEAIQAGWADLQPEWV